MTVPTPEATTSFRRPRRCRYFNLPSGCRNENCPFAHISNLNGNANAKNPNKGRKADICNLVPSSVGGHPVNHKTGSVSVKSLSRSKSKNSAARASPDVSTETPSTSSTSTISFSFNPAEEGTGGGKDSRGKKQIQKSSRGAKSSAVGNPSDIGQGQPQPSINDKNHAIRKKKSKCKYGTKCRTKNCKFSHPLDAQNDNAESASAESEASKFQNVDASLKKILGVAQDQDGRSVPVPTPSGSESAPESKTTKPESPKKKSRQCRYKENCRNSTCKFEHPATMAVNSTGTSNVTKPPQITDSAAPQVPQTHKSKLEANPKSSKAASAAQPQFTDSNIDQLLFGEGSSELWNHLDNSKSLDIATLPLAGSDERSRSSNRSGSTRKSDPSKKMALRREQEVALRLQQEEKERIRMMQQKVLNNNNGNGQRREQGRARNDAMARVKANAQAEAETRAKAAALIRARAEAEALKEKAEAMARSKAEAQKRAKAKADAIARARNEAKANEVAAMEEARALALAKAKAQEEAKARALAAEKARALAAEKARAEAKSREEAKAKALALAEEQARAVKAQREEKERAREKARAEAKAKRDKEIEAARVEEEKRAKAFAEEQAAKAKLLEEQKAARAEKLRQEKEAARLKKAKKEAMKTMKGKQIREERLKFWETDRIQRNEFARVYTKFCVAEAKRLTGVTKVDKNIVNKICDHEGAVYNALYPNLGSQRVKISLPKNKQHHNRTGTVITWDENKNKYKVELDNKKQTCEYAYFTPDSLEALDISSTGKKNSRNDHDSDSDPISTTICTPLVDIIVTNILIEKLRLAYRLDPDSLDIKVKEEIAERTRVDALEKERREKELRRHREEKLKREAEYARYREKEKARQAEEEEERARRYHESQRAKERAREAAREARRSARRNGPFGGNSPFGSRSPFGSGMGGFPFGFGGGSSTTPGIGIRIGPDGRPSIFIFERDSDDDSDEFFFEDEHFHHDEEEDGATREDHAEALGVSVDATLKEVKTAYRRMALRFHPDKYQAEKTEMTKEEAEEHFKKCSAAYQYFVERLEE